MERPGGAELALRTPVATIFLVWIGVAVGAAMPRHAERPREARRPMKMGQRPSNFGGRRWAKAAIASLEILRPPERLSLWSATCGRHDLAHVAGAAGRSRTFTSTAAPLIRAGNPPVRPADFCDVDFDHVAGLVPVNVGDDERVTGSLAAIEAETAGVVEGDALVGHVERRSGEHEAMLR